MMDGEHSSSRSTWRLVFHYLACYILWFVICGIGLWLVLFASDTIKNLFFLRATGWQVDAIGRWMVFFFGAVWIVSIFLVEGYLRKAVEEGKLWSHAGRVLLVQFIIAALFFLISIVS
jgi:uncharacterized membrane protein